MTPALLILGSRDDSGREHAINTAHIRKLITDVAMFGSAKAEELDLLAAGSKIVSLARGSSLFHQGDPCTGFYLVLSG